MPNERIKELTILTLLNQIDIELYQMAWNVNLNGIIRGFVGISITCVVCNLKGILKAFFMMLGKRK